MPAGNRPSAAKAAFAARTLSSTSANMLYEEVGIRFVRQLAGFFRSFGSAYRASPGSSIPSASQNARCFKLLLRVKRSLRRGLGNNRILAWLSKNTEDAAPTQSARPAHACPTIVLERNVRLARPWRKQ